MKATSERILMVEDEPDIQSIARIALEALGGFTVQLCGSGAEALRAVPRFQPDLILMDVMMPGMDGIATFQNLRASGETAEFPVIFMTAKVQPQEISHYRSMGALGVISKPFDPMTLADTVRSLWERHLVAAAR